MGEVDTSFTFHEFRGQDTRTARAVEDSAFREQVALRAGVLDRPGLAAIKTPGEHVRLRLLPVDVMPVAEILVIAL